MAAEILFVLSLLVLAYTYAGYVLLVYVASRVWVRRVVTADQTPSVSLIIAAYNEEQSIASKIENSLALDYPRNRLEVIVASDCSTDRTDAITRGYLDRGVLLHRRPERLGKSVAQNRAVKTSSGEILIFTDATTICRPDMARRIVRSFADPEVGCVAGQLVYVDSLNTATGKGCQSYWSYEKLLRECESRLGSLIGVSGCLYAVRRSCYSQIAIDMSSDFAIALEMHLQGLRTVYEPEAVAIEDTNTRGVDELRMRVRVIEQTMSALNRYRTVLNPLSHGLFSIQMISHKVLRYSVPLFLLIALVSNVLLSGTAVVYQVTIAAQIIFYLAALIGWFAERNGVKLGRAGIPYYFALANLASVLAFVKFIQGKAHVLWEPLRESPGTKGSHAG